MTREEQRLASRNGRRALVLVLIWLGVHCWASLALLEALEKAMW